MSTHSLKAESITGHRGVTLRFGLSNMNSGMITEYVIIKETNVGAVHINEIYTFNPSGHISLEIQKKDRNGHVVGRQHKVMEDCQAVNSIGRLYYEYVGEAEDSGKSGVLNSSRANHLLLELKRLNQRMLSASGISGAVLQ